MSLNKPAHWGFWASLLWCLPIALLFALLQIAALFLAASPDDPDSTDLLMNADSNGTLLTYATLATGIGCSLLILGIIRLKKGSRVRDYLAWQGVPPAIALRWFLLLTALMILSDALMAGLGQPVIPEFMSRSHETAEPRWLFWLALVLAAPLFEELMFRGFLMRGLQESFLGTTGALLLTSLLWSALHLQYDHFGLATVFAFGLALGLARIRTGSLPLSIALHAYINGVASLQTALFG